MTNNKSEEKKNISARELAVKILLQVFHRGAYSNLALDRGLNNSHLQANDRGLVTELVNGTVRMKKHLDWVLNLFLAKKGKELPSRIHMILISAIYQLLFLERVPTYAVINEAVNMARKGGGPSTSGMVNGILRNLERNRTKIVFPDPKEDQLGYLSTYYSHPEWIVRRWLSRYGYEETRELLIFNNQAPSMTIRVNTLKTDTDALLDLLKVEGVEARRGTVAKSSITIDSLPGPLFRLPSYRQGLFYVQSEATMLIAPALNPQPGQMIYDFCSGVGGKATHLAELMCNQGEVKSLELYSHKMELLKLNCERLGISIVEPCPGDILEREFTAKADGALLDAPCSGLGVLRSRADLRWRREETDILETAELQLKMLDRAASTVRTGGSLVYSTCTLEPEENEQVVETFLTNNPGFETEDLVLPLDFFPFTDEGRVTARQGTLTTFPPQYHIDGMFIALMRRR